MSDLRLILDENIEAEIENIRSFNLSYEFDEFSPNINLTSDFSPIFRGLNNDRGGYQYILDYIRNNPGINIPAKIKDTRRNEILKRAVLDLYSQSANYRPNEQFIQVPLKNINTNFFEKANALSLKDFYDSSNFLISVYTREKRPDYLETIILSLALYNLTKAVIDQAKDTYAAITAAIPRGPFDVGVFIVAAINAIVQIIILAALLIAVNELLKQLSEALFGKPRRFNAVNVVDVCRRGCAALGFNFESTALQPYEEMRYTRRQNLINLDGDYLAVIKGTPLNDPLPDESLLDWLTRWATLTNSKLRITDDNTVRLEQVEYYEQRAIDYNVTDLFKQGSTAYTLSSTPRFISVRFDSNLIDGNLTENKYSISYSIAGNDKDLDLESIKEKLEINLPYQVPRRKEKQTTIEKSFNALFDIVRGTNKENRVKPGDRKGFITMDGDTFTSDLIFIANGNKVSNLNKELLSAKYIYQNYYITKSPPLNQWLIYKNDRSQEEITPPEVIAELINNNFVKDWKGRPILLNKNKRDVLSGLFQIEFRRRMTAEDLGYVPIDKWEITEVANETPQQNKESFKAYIKTIATALAG
jgi:hypothetical protein